MITRHYFYSASRYRADSSQESWQHGTFSTKSWLPAPRGFLLDKAQQLAKEAMDKRHPNNTYSVRLAAFNRI